MHYLGELLTAPEELALQLKTPGVQPERVRNALQALRTSFQKMEFTPTDLSPEWSDFQDDEWEKEMEEGPRKIKKTYTPEHAQAKYPFPNTGLEEALLYVAAWEKLLDVKVPDKDVIRVALEETPPAQLYLKEWETRYYLPKEIEDLPETDRKSATLKLLREIESSNEFLKNLSPLPEHS